MALRGSDWRFGGFWLFCETFYIVGGKSPQKRRIFTLDLQVLRPRIERAGIGDWWRGLKGPKIRLRDPGDRRGGSRRACSVGFWGAIGRRDRGMCDLPAMTRPRGSQAGKPAFCLTRSRNPGFQMQD